MHLILYQRDDCPLCDQALAVLAAAHAPDFEAVWIDDDVRLEAIYGDRVPVLRDVDSRTELQWPFDAVSVRLWLATQGAST
ncbi:MAG: glutaredoxin family protein [Rhodanobacteraceae bacterium]